MKKYNLAIYFLIIIIVLSATGLYFYFNKNTSITLQKKKIKLLSDSVLVLNDANRYYASQLKFQMTVSNTNINDDVKVYDITQDTTKSVPKSLKAIFKNHTYNIALRYTEIGCNECSSLTIKKLNELRKIYPEVAIYALVDFTNYDSYLQWRKVGEISFPVYYIRKGGISYDEHCQEYSYIFVADNKSRTSNFFIPNSGMPDMLTYYFEHTLDINK